MAFVAVTDGRMVPSRSWRKLRNVVLSGPYHFGSCLCRVRAARGHGDGSPAFFASIDAPSLRCICVRARAAMDVRLSLPLSACPAAVVHRFSSNLILVGVVVLARLWASSRYLVLGGPLLSVACRRPLLLACSWSYGFVHRGMGRGRALVATVSARERSWIRIQRRAPCLAAANRRWVHPPIPSRRTPIVRRCSPISCPCGLPPCWGLVGVACAPSTPPAFSASGGRAVR